MTLTCPRCGTEVQTEAQYCTYCSLPKPKRGFSASDEKPQETTQVERSKAAIAPKNASKDRSAGKDRVASKNRTAGKDRSESKDQLKSVTHPTPGPGKPPRKLRVSVLSVAAIVALFSIGIYTFVVPMVYSEEAEPKTVLAALNNLRKTPSNEPGLTIDARLSRELDTARRVGNLIAYQGWVVRPIKGTKNKVVLAFSYLEAGGINQNAEWIANLTDGTFAPQTDLAAAVSSR